MSFIEIKPFLLARSMIGVASYLLFRPTTTTASTNIRDQVFITKAIFDNEPTSLESSEV